MVSNNQIGFNLEKESIYFEANMPKEEVLRLAKLASEGDKEAKEALILGHLRFMKYIIHQYRNRGLSYEDLFQEGSLGLIQAVEKFDYRKNIMFSTFAASYIIRNIQRALIEAELIALPEDLAIEVKRYQYTVNSMHMELGRLPSDQETAERMGISENRVRKLKKSIYYYLSIDQAGEVPKDSGERPGVLITKRVEEPRDMAEAVDEQIFRKLELLDFPNMENVLTEREERILSMRFNQKHGNRTFEEIAEVLGGSSESIRVAYHKAIHKLREYLLHRGVNKI